MGTGYTRNDTSNNIADGNIINASDLDGEFNAIESAMGTSGHTHDGTSAEGGPVTVIGPVQDFIASGTAFTAKGTGYDLGSTGTEFEDLFLTGKAYIDGFGESTLFDTTSKIQFRDSALFINSSADGQLDLEADTTIELTAPTVVLTNDLSLQSDGAILNFGTNDEITVTHVHNTGLNSKSANGFVLGLQTSHTSIVENDVLGKIEFSSPNQTGGGDGALVGASIEAVAEATFSTTVNSSALVFKTNTGDAAIERMRIKSDGNIVFTNPNGLTISNTADNFVIDAVGDIVLDSDDGDIQFKDTGTVFMNLYESSNSAMFYNPISDGDIKFQGKDGTNAITVLTLDMSEAGAATFNSTITLKDTLNISSTSTTGFLQASSNVLQFGTSSNDRIDFYANNDIAAVINADRSFTFNYPISGTNATFTSATTEEPLVILKNTTNDANSAILRFVKDKGAAGVDGDDAGEIEFYADNDAQEQILFARIKGEVKDASDGAEGGRFKFQVASHDGEMITGLSLSDGNAEDEVDVVIGNGSDSLTEIAGDLLIPNGAISLGQTNFTGASTLLDLHASGSGVGSQIAFANDHNTDKFFVGLAGNTTGNAILYQQKNADIEFYTNNAIRATLNNEGNLGLFGDGGSQNIDHYSNYTTLTLSNSTGGIIQFEDDGVLIGEIFNGTNHLTIGSTASGSSLKLRSGAASQAMEIDSSGRVGIGAAPNTNWRNDIADQKVLMLGTEATFFSDSGVTTALINNAYINNSDTFVNISTRGASQYFQYEGAHKWYTAASASGGSNINTEMTTPKMTLDISGNLLVGCTSPVGIGNGTNEGVSISSSNKQIIVGVDSDVALYLNLQTSDGDIQVFRKDGSTVGSIGTKSSGLFIGSDDAGIFFNDHGGGDLDAIYPYDVGTNTFYNGHVNIGGPSNKFKNIYISGSLSTDDGITFGDAGGSGTSTSNTLDSYEQGTFTPEYTAQTGSGQAVGGTQQRVGNYIKVGNVVTATFYLFIANTDTSGNTSTNQVYVSGLPFAAKNVSSAASGYVNTTRSTGTFGAFINAPTHVRVSPNDTQVQLNKARTTVESPLLVSDFTSSSGNRNHVNFSVTYIAE